MFCLGLLEIMHFITWKKFCRKVIIKLMRFKGKEIDQDKFYSKSFSNKFFNG